MLAIGIVGVRTADAGFEVLQLSDGIPVTHSCQLWCIERLVAFASRAVTGDAGLVQRFPTRRVARYSCGRRSVRKRPDIGHHIRNGRIIGKRHRHRRHLLAVGIAGMGTANALFVILQLARQIPVFLASDLGRI